jgi:hypothetical protein
VRICRGVYLGAALFALLAHLLLGLGGRVFPLWLPICLALGFAASLLQPRNPARCEPRPRAWVLGGTITVIALVVLAFVLDLARMPPHSWDAVAAWSLKTRYLLANPTLSQPFFQDPGVWHHSRDYPLLQPLCLASCQALVGERGGRMFFVALYVWMVCTTGLAVRQAGAGRDAACAAAAALGLTPILVDPTSGGFTSGYADAFLATAVTGAAAGLLLRDSWLLAAATVLIVLVKPEGLVYGAVVVAVPWLRDQRPLLLSALCGFILAAGLWLPIQLQLQQSPVASGAWLVWPLLVGLGTSLVLTQDWVRPSQRPAWLLMLVSVLAAAGLLTLLKILAGLGPQQGGLTVYFQDLGRLVQRLPRLPRILWGLVSYLLSWRKVGLLFVFLGAWALLHKRLRPGIPPAPTPASPPARSLWLLLALAAPCLVMPYLLSTEEDLAHHLRSSMARLLLHWLGAGWLLAGLGISQVLAQVRMPAAEDTA